MRRCLSEDVVRQIQTDVAIQQELENEFEQLTQDRDNIRAILPSGDSKVRDRVVLHSPCSLSVQLLSVCAQQPNKRFLFFFYLRSSCQ